MLSYLLSQSLQTGLLPLGTSYAFLFSTIRAACHAHLIVLIVFDYVQITTLPLCGLLQSPVTFFISGPAVNLSVLFSDAFSLFLSLSFMSTLVRPCLWTMQTSLMSTLVRPCLWTVQTSLMSTLVRPCFGQCRQV